MEPFNVVQILSELLKADDRRLFKSLHGYGIHKSLINLRLPIGKGVLKFYLFRLLFENKN